MLFCRYVEGVPFADGLNLRPIRNGHIFFSVENGASVNVLPRVFFIGYTRLMVGWQRGYCSV